MRKGGENTMKTLEELYKEVQGNEELKKEFIAAFKEGRLEEFLKSQNSDAAPADVMAFLNGTKEEIVSEDDLAKVAGGCFSSYTCYDGCSQYTITDCPPT